MHAGGIVKTVIAASALQKIALFISAFSFACSFTCNELNLRLIKQEGQETRCGQTIITADDRSYLDPAENFIKGMGFRENAPGRGSYFLRPPGYSLFYMAFRSLTNEENALWLLKMAQLLLFSLSVYCLFFIAFACFQSGRWAIVVSIIYGCTPLCCGFLYYTLTEGITPALMIFYAFFLIRAHSQKQRKSKILHYLLGSAVFSFLFITRPVMGIAGLALPVFLVYDYFGKTRIHNFMLLLFVCGFTAAAPMLFWQFRNYHIAGRYVGLHPVYYPENNYVFRPAHRALWEFEKSWGSRGDAFHGSIMPVWKACLEGDSSEHWIDTLLQNVPEYVINRFGQDQLRDIFGKYRGSMLTQMRYKERGLPMPAVISREEKEVVEGFTALADTFRREFPFRYLLGAPVKTLGRMIFHSNLSLYMFQHTFRGRWWMEGLRYLFFIIHSLSFSLFLLALLRKMKVTHVFTVLIPLIYLAYLAFFQRGVEERYTLPVLPLVLLGAGGVAAHYLGIARSAGRKFFSR